MKKVWERIKQAGIWIAGALGVVVLFLFRRRSTKGISEVVSTLHTQEGRVEQRGEDLDTAVEHAKDTVERVESETESIRKDKGERDAKASTFFPNL